MNCKAIVLGFPEEVSPEFVASTVGVQVRKETFLAEYLSRTKRTGDSRTHLLDEPKYIEKDLRKEASSHASVEAVTQNHQEHQ